MLRRNASMVALALAWLAGSAGAQDAWGDLEAGPHAVGFRSEIVLDHARRYRTTYDYGATYGAGGKAPRPILVNVWYPAEAEDAPPVMPYRDYFAIGSEDARLDRWARALAAFATDVSCTELVGTAVGELDDAGRDAWERFLDMPTRAHPGARPLPGPFPFVVYHSGAGSSFEDNSVLCEYLASHGFAVLGSAYCSADGSSLEIDSRDGSVRDMEFLARHARGLPFVDWRRGAFGGHSAGAQVSMRALLRPDCPADAVFLLDTTADYYSLALPNYRYLVDPVLENPTVFTVPMLVSAGHEASFQLCDAMTGADRTYLTLPDLDHNEFIAQGVLRLRVRRDLKEGEEDEALARELAREPEVSRLYAALCEATRLFLDAELRGERSPFDALRDRLADHLPGGPEPCVERAPRGVAGPPAYDPASDRPPTPRQLRSLLDGAGLDGLLDTLEAHRKGHPESPVYTSGMLMGSLLYDLAVEDRVGEARALHAWLTGIGLDAIGTLRFMAYMNALVGRKDRARDVLQVALSVAPDDERTLERLRALDEGR